MAGVRVRELLVCVVLVGVAISPVGPTDAAERTPGSAPANDDGGPPEIVIEVDVDAEATAVQRATEADYSPAPVPDLADPPGGLDMRRPRLGPGGLYLPRDAADPDILVVRGTYYLFSTNTTEANVPTWSSPDLATWRYRGDALPELPRWANAAGGTTWAPSVHRVGGGYNLYFSALNESSGKFCIGVATASVPVGGPFRPRQRPLVCQPHRGGSIDPYLFADGRSGRFLLYKTDGNCCDIKAKLWSQRLTGDGLRVAGRPNELLFAGAEWEGGIIEGPTMVERGGRYHLFYSGNWWHTHHYAIGHAICESIRGPCFRSSDEPFMVNRSDGVGFGGPSIWEPPSGEVWMTYHGWYGPGVGYENGGVRAAFAHRLDFPDWRPPPTCFGVAATIIGTNGADTITGTPGRDVIVARDGADVVNGGGGADLVCGGAGDDAVRAGRGNDRIRGGPGRDTVNADGGKDAVQGGPGDDALRGGLGTDRVWGAGGSDVCWGESLRCEDERRTRHDGT